MSDNDKVFTGSIPEIYDTHLVPLIFQAYADDIASRVSATNPGDVLETAAGSGVVTRALAPRLKEDARFTVTDLNQPMLDRAQSVQDNKDRIKWQQADALELPFADDAFDVVVCQFGVMFFPDRVAGYKEARRVLRPGGQFLFNAWDHIRDNVFADVVTQAAGTVFPDDPPLFLARTPHGYHDADQIRGDLNAAGFDNVAIETVTKETVAQSPRDAAIAFCQGTPLRNEIEKRDGDSLAHVTDVAEKAIAERFGEGEVRGKMQARVVSAVA